MGKEGQLRFLTRDEAKDTLEAIQMLFHRGMISESLNNKIQDIITCIDLEESGFHIWGAPVADVSIILREPPYTLKEKQRIENVRRKYRFEDTVNS